MLPFLAVQRMDLTFWINNSKANAAGKVPVSLRITIHGTRAECSTGIRCHPVQWDKTQKRLVSTGKGDKAAADLNAMLETLEAKARLLPLLLLPLPGALSITAAQVKANLLPGKPAPIPCAMVLLEGAIALHTNPYSQASDRTALRAFCAYVVGPRLPLPNLTATYIAGFAQSTTTALRYLPRLSALFSLARPKDSNPFMLDSPARGRAAVPIRRRYVLTRAELVALADLVLPVGSRAAVARDIYLCQYYLHGSRLGPVLELEWHQVDWVGHRVHFRAEKGGGWHDVALRPALAAVLKRYSPAPSGLVFPPLPEGYAAQDANERYRLRKTATATVWHGLQQCAKLLKLPGRLHSHTARHSLATHTVEATGNIRVAQGLLGHKSAGTTEKYIRGMMTKELDAAADTVYGH